MTRRPIALQVRGSIVSSVRHVLSHCDSGLRHFSVLPRQTNRSDVSLSQDLRYRMPRARWPIRSQGSPLFFLIAHCRCQGSAPSPRGLPYLVVNYIRISSILPGFGGFNREKLTDFGSKSNKDAYGWIAVVSFVFGICEAWHRNSRGRSTVENHNCRLNGNGIFLICTVTPQNDSTTRWTYWSASSTNHNAVS